MDITSYSVELLRLLRSYQKQKFYIVPIPLFKNFSIDLCARLKLHGRLPDIRIQRFLSAMNTTGLIYLSRKFQIDSE